MNTYLIKRKIRKKLVRTLAVFAVLLFILAAIVITAEIRLAPTIKSIASQKAKNAVTLLINEKAYEIMTSDKLSVSYDDLIKLEKDNDGKITAVRADTLKLGHIETLLTSEVARSIGHIPTDTLKIPLGNIISSSALMSGKGPEINVRLLRYGNVTARLTNEFKDAGINQTNHRIILTVNTTVCVIIPFSSFCEDITTDICIAETVIVGNVPEAYTRVTYGPESVVGDVMDFGANADDD